MEDGTGTGRRRRMGLETCPHGMGTFLHCSFVPCCLPLCPCCTHTRCTLPCLGGGGQKSFPFLSSPLSPLLPPCVVVLPSALLAQLQLTQLCKQDSFLLYALFPFCLLLWRRFLNSFHSCISCICVCIFACHAMFLLLHF